MGALVRQKLFFALLTMMIVSAGMYLGFEPPTILLAFIVFSCVAFFFSRFGLATVALAFVTVCSVAFFLGRS